MVVGSEEGSYLRLIDFVYHSTLGLRVIKKRRRDLTEVRKKMMSEKARMLFSSQLFVSSHLRSRRVYRVQGLGFGD